MRSIAVSNGIVTLVMTAITPEKNATSNRNVIQDSPRNDQCIVSVMAMLRQLRCATRYNRAVRRAVKLFGRGLLAFLLLVILAVGYSTTQRHATWWRRVPNAAIAVNGIRAGYLHQNCTHSRVIITRTDLSPPQSYLVDISDRRWLIHCGDWHAPKFVIFPIGHVNAPCSIFGNDSPRADHAEFSTLVVHPGFIEFSTVQGKHVTASW